ncbi:MAG: tRNA 2-selenouridine(34) synthase MnmH, partial [Firmicutes bacterium]|nr:tRNA 2-selenouridine(34) synthase MnmH [Bacillota bacterium]
QEATSSLVKRLGKARVEELNILLAERKFETVFAHLLKNYYDPLYKYPDGPSEDYHLSVDTADIEKAADVIYDFVKDLQRRS